jgi:hypothetical protein
MVPAHDASPTTVLEELDSDGVSPTTVMPPGHSTAPAVQAVIVERVAVLTHILLPSSEMSCQWYQVPRRIVILACPTRSKVMRQPRRVPACVAVIHPRTAASIGRPCGGSSSGNARLCLESSLASSQPPRSAHRHARAPSAANGGATRPARSCTLSRAVWLMGCWPEACSHHQLLCSPQGCHPGYDASLTAVLEELESHGVSRRW